jgi:putative ABC transport system permease protein
MLKNYLIVAFRNLRRYKFHSFINIVGLGIGMAVVGLIGLWIWDEYTYDRYNPQYDHIARLMQNETSNGETRTTSSLPYPLLAELRTTYGGAFKRVVGSWWTRDHVLRFGDKKITERGKFMEPGAAELLALRMLQGEGGALRDPGSILLSTSAARAMFGSDAAALGQTLHIDGKLSVAVRGVYDDLPENSIFKGVEFIAPLELLVHSEASIKDNTTQWGWDMLEIYVELNDNVDVQLLSQRLKHSTLTHMGNNPLAAGYRPEVFVQPMNRWHLFSDFKGGINTGGAIQYVWLFGTIGFFVLLLACINFMNLSTARSERRAREVGIRKAIGSARGQLVALFYSESLVVAFVAFLLAAGLAAIALPWFNVLADKHIVIQWFSPAIWLAGFTFSAATGLLAGSYPALYLSSFRPVVVLKGGFKAGRWAAVPRRTLVVLQFSVSMLLIISTIVVFHQIQFARNRSAGYDRAGLLTLPITVQEFSGRADLLRHRLLQTGVVAGAAMSSSPLTQVWESYSGFNWPGKDPALQDDISVISVTSEFGSTIDWRVLEGRDFSPGFATDSSGIIINEATVAYMGLKHPIGTVVKWGPKSYTVLGVVKNMIQESPYGETRQTVYLLDNDFNNYWWLIRTKPGVAMADVLPVIRKAFLEVLPSAIFDYRFVDDDYARKFAVEQRVGTLAGFFAGFALFISALGIFGMASFVAEQRTKEVGVRRVLGATVFNIWSLLSREFVLLVGLSLAIAGPLAWFGMHRWLQGYTYHTGIAWWIFVVTGVGALSLTLLTVSWTSVRAALANPVKSLRSE